MQRRAVLFVMMGFFLFAGCQPAPGAPTEAVPSPTPGEAAAPTATPAASATPAPSPTPAVQDTVRVPPDEAVLLGYYPRGVVRNTVDEIQSFDDWIASTDKQVSIAATFLNFNDPDLEQTVPAELESAWENGYIAFVNLSVGGITAEEIANGELDDRIRAWARAYRDWAGEGGRRAFIAPLQEMNGYWTSYGMDPENYLRSYERIQRLFYEEEVDPRTVSWVFAPNGWSPQGHEFEKYYPGDERVDVVGFSSFNFGDCSSYPKWETFEDIFKPYLDRMAEMAPDKPIFIAEIGTVGKGGDKAQWLTDTYQQLADYPGLRGILYFNRSEIGSSLASCEGGADYRIYDYQEQVGSSAFLKAVSLPDIVYYPPDSPALSEIMFNRP